MRACDTCKLSPSAVYCHTHSAFLCSPCDAHSHAPHRHHHRHHHRVPLCEACEHAPSAFTCNADAASLCVTCDFHVHAANSIAGRHRRLPVPPLPEAADQAEVEREIDSWLMLNGDGGDDDDDIDDVTKQSSVLLGNSSSTATTTEDDTDHNSVVPTISEARDQQNRMMMMMMMEHHKPPLINYHPSYLRMSVPLPFDISSYKFGRGIQIFPNGPSVSSLLMQPHMMMKRKEGVLKYREKKKSRKFEKRIRYAYRKAYAEKRPRVKGRFVKTQDLTSHS
ncbi:Zinc finger protein CONSTANS-LIKE 2 [Senna tora]|uniref:Zinc finger protein CONSTANS-LIKE 2 n=1 Tax=Senna tora TaxID=362788 RepID=A0A835CFA6_9FABA|nr:Zinc finger protein CONSTANS-LIKE 2 [Senna tora]